MSAVERARRAATAMQTRAASIRLTESWWPVHALPWLVKTSGDERLAEHLAAWTPAVAVALGAFLDDLADMDDERAIQIDMWPTLCAFVDAYLADQENES